MKNATNLKLQTRRKNIWIISRGWPFDKSVYKVLVFKWTNAEVAICCINKMVPPGISAEG